MSYAIGIDMGGTNVKVACISPDGEVLSEEHFGTKDDAQMEWAENIRKSVVDLKARRKEEPIAIGLSAPGLAAPDMRSIGWMGGRVAKVQGLDWTKFLGSPKLVPVLNDAHAALLGEVWKGAAKGKRNVVLLTLGTGVGGAIMVDGRLLKGQIGRAGHLGHICIDVNGAPDIVNTPGSLEESIGNCSVARRTGGRFSSTRLLVEAHLNGDRAASAVWLKSVRDLACGLVSIMNAVDPEVIILGGGIALAGPALFDPLSKHLDEIEWRPGGHRVQIVPAQIGDFAGALGAAWNAMNVGKEKQ